MKTLPVGTHVIVLTKYRLVPKIRGIVLELVNTAEEQKYYHPNNIFHYVVQYENGKISRYVNGMRLIRL